MAFNLTAVLKLKDEFSRPMSKAAKSTDELSKGASNLKNSIAGLGLGALFAGIGKSVLNTGMEFEASISSLKAVTQAGTADMAKMEKQAIELGSSTQFSASEAADAMTFLGMAF